MTGLPEGLKSYLRTPFVMIVWVMETYGKNRDRLRAFMDKPRVSLAFKVMLALTVVVWLVIGFTASEEYRHRLTDAVQGLWSEAQDLNEQKKQLNLQKEQQAGEAAQ